MNIKLVQYPYKDYKVGEVVDLGSEKNRSMVAIGRAVWEEAPKIEPKKETVEVTEEKEAESEKIETAEPAENNKESKESTKKPKKKLIENTLKKEIVKKTSDKKGFWDKLK